MPYLFAFDVSGGITPEMFDKMVEKAKTISTSPMIDYACQFDLSVHSITTMNEVNTEINGGGGTTVGQVLKKAREMGLTPVIFTDGYFGDDTTPLKTTDHRMYILSSRGDKWKPDHLPRIDGYIDID